MKSDGLVAAPHGLLRVHERDTVAVALHDLKRGTLVEGPAGPVSVSEDIPAGHKMALSDAAVGDPIIKYGYAIGLATHRVRTGDWVHSHNLSTDLGNEHVETAELESAIARPAPEPLFFDGYRRRDGRVGTRNELWVINTVGCVNRAAVAIAEAANELYRGAIDGAYAFVHPFGCSQLGDDLSMTRSVLAGLIRHPNAGGVLVVGLGCENNQLKALMAAAVGADPDRIRFFNAQEVEDEISSGLAAAAEVVALMRYDVRSSCPVSDLVIGVKCGGSDGFSGVTANPLVGRVTDRVTAAGGAAILSEVPEMFGAENALLRRAVNRETYEKAHAMIESFKAYYADHGQPIYENPSPGNKAGGLTTLEEKSLGAVQKGGSASICGVLDYGEAIQGRGLMLLRSPGNDAVSSTAEVVSGATLLLFTTGRGTPLGFPAPTIKIASNDDIAVRKPHWIDFSAGPVLNGYSQQKVADDLMTLVLDIASGRKLARNEVNGIREIAIWKQGVTL